MVVSFLLALATGARASEWGSILRSEDALVFPRDRVTLYPNPNFLAKTEHPLLRRDPLFIPGLREANGSPHALCPVRSLLDYLSATRKTTAFIILVQTASLEALSITKIRLLIYKFIRTADPGLFS